MTERQYIFTSTRYICGCVYRTVSDIAIFCPQHRDEWHRGTIISQETIKIPSPETPDLPGLVMHSWAPTTPVVLRNTASNSIHNETSVLDGQGNHWSAKEEDLTGICAACFIDEEQLLETNIAMCECGAESCSYRWCGRTDGLHGFWKLHAQGRSEETVGRAESDIFSYGSYTEQTPEIRAVLDQEGENLRTQADQLFNKLTEARHSANSSDQNQGERTGYLTPWLDQTYNTMTTSSEPQQRNRATKIMKDKLTRLHVIGAMPPPEAPNRLFPLDQPTP